MGGMNGDVYRGPAASLPPQPPLPCATRRSLLSWCSTAECHQSSQAPAGAVEMLEKARCPHMGSLAGARSLCTIHCWRAFSQPCGSYSLLASPPLASIQDLSCKQKHHTNHLGVCSKRGQALLRHVVQQGQGVQVARPRLHIADGRYPGVTQRHAPAGKGQGRIQARGSAWLPCSSAKQHSTNAWMLHPHRTLPQAARCCNEHALQHTLSACLAHQPIVLSAPEH